MAISNAISGLGVEFKRGDGTSSETFTKIAELVDIKGPNMSRDTTEVTNHDNNQSGYKEFLGLLRDAGDITLTVHFTYSGYNDMVTDFENDDTVNYQLELPDAGNTTWEFAGLVTGLSLAPPLNDKITHDVTIKVSGKPTLTNTP